MKDLKYYNEISTSHKTISQFKKDLDSELDAFVGTRAQLKEEESKIDERANQLYKENQNKRLTEKIAKREEFKQDLATVYGVSEHPNMEMLFEKVWDTSHDAGLHEVVNSFEYWVELIKD